jgi:hypothetical protein
MFYSFLIQLNLKSKQKDSFTVENLIENLTYKSTDGRVGQANFDPLILEDIFKRTIDDLKKINEKSKQKIETLTTECQKEKALVQDKVNGLESLYKTSYDNLIELDKRISTVSVTMSEMGSQLENLNKPRFNLYESQKTAKYFDKFMDGADNTGVFADESKLDQAAEVIYKLNLISNDLTDYMSLLLGKAEFRFNCGNLDNGYNYKLTLHYTKGTPAHLYSTVHEVWNEIYPFGDYSNLQPVELQTYEFPDNAVAAKLKLVSTGHGWGDLNTSNAAEFYNAIHHIWVNNVQTFEQHNWYDCNPNPDACQPQNGTWYYDRAGWCPGAIAQWYDYDMTPYVAGNTVDLKYVFYENYVDLCHPSNPNCVTGVTCTNCADGFNPTLDVACNLVVFSENPVLTGLDKRKASSSSFSIRPNPAISSVEVYAFGTPATQSFPVQLLSMTGTVLGQYEWDGKSVRLDLSQFPRGIYLVKISTSDKTEMKKLVLQ